MQENNDNAGHFSNINESGERDIQLLENVESTNDLLEHNSEDKDLEMSCPTEVSETYISEHSYNSLTIQPPPYTLKEQVIFHS